MKVVLVTVLVVCGIYNRVSIQGKLSQTLAKEAHCSDSFEMIHLKVEYNGIESEAGKPQGK